MAITIEFHGFEHAARSEDVKACKRDIMATMNTQSQNDVIFINADDEPKSPSNASLKAFVRIFTDYVLRYPGLLEICRKHNMDVQLIKTEYYPVSK